MMYFHMKHDIHQEKNAGWGLILSIGNRLDFECGRYLLLEEEKSKKKSPEQESHFRGASTF